MKKNIIDLLQETDAPHLYLVHVGLSQAEYNETSKLSLDKKEALVKKIISQASPEEILKIVNDLMRLELSIETNNPIRSGNRLVGTFIRSYLTHKEQNNFREFYAPDKSLNDYPIPDVVKNLWVVVKNAAKDVLNQEQFDEFMAKGFRITPVFYYQQLLPELTPQEFRQGKKPVELTRDNVLVDGFNQNLMPNKDSPLPELASGIELRAHLQRIKEHIKETQWQVGGYLLFKGGVMHGKQRVPHRVKDILTLIERAEKDPQQLQAIYAEIVATAKEAIDEPKVGRTAPTTEFYEDIFHHRVLNAEYPFKIRGADNAPLLQ